LVKKPSIKVTHIIFEFYFILLDTLDEDDGADAIHDNIDIARDYLLYSAAKSSRDEKSFSQYDNSLFQNQEEYAQHKFFERQRDRDHAYKLLQDQVIFFSKSIN